jgi:hypothetical protein
VDHPGGRAHLARGRRGAPAAKDNLIPAVPGAEPTVLNDLPTEVVEALRGAG